MASGFTKLPLTDEQYKRWAEEADPDVVAAIDSKLAYLCHYEITDIPVSVSINSVVINSNSVGSYSHHSVVEDDDVYVVSYKPTSARSWSKMPYWKRAPRPKLSISVP